MYTLCRNVDIEIVQLNFFIVYNIHILDDYCKNGRILEVVLFPIVEVLIKNSAQINPRDIATVSSNLLVSYKKNDVKPHVLKLFKLLCKQLTPTRLEVYLMNVSFF